MIVQSINLSSWNGKMKSRGLRIFIGGFVSFFLIFISFTIITGIILFNSLNSGQKYLISAIQSDAEHHVIMLAQKMSASDPLNLANKKSKRYWLKNSEKRIIKIGEQILSFPMADHGLELFFLSDTGKIISTNNLDKFLEKRSAKLEISGQYNTGFFHRAAILSPGNGSVRSIPRDFALDYNRLFQEKVRQKYGLQPVAKKESPRDFTLDNLTLLIARLLNQELNSLVLDATSPVIGNQNRVLGTAHYIVSLLPVYAFIENVLDDALDSYLIGIGIIFVLSFLVVFILFLIQPVSQQVLVRDLRPDISISNFPEERQKQLDRDDRKTLAYHLESKPDVFKSKSTLSESTEKSSLLEKAEKYLQDGGDKGRIRPFTTRSENGINDLDKSVLKKELGKLSDYKIEEERKNKANTMMQSKEKMEANVFKRPADYRGEKLGVVIKKEKLFNGISNGTDNQLDYIPEAIFLED